VQWVVIAVHVGEGCLDIREAADQIANEIIKKEKDQHCRERKMMSYREETNQ
jgi:hypothetical protein